MGLAIALFVLSLGYKLFGNKNAASTDKDLFVKNADADVPSCATNSGCTDSGSSAADDS